MHTFKMLIDGQLIGSPQELPVINPATGQVFTHCPRATTDHVELAVQAAKRAFAMWRLKPLTERAAVLNKIADAFDARKEEIAETLTREQGKPIAQARDEVTYASIFCRHFAGMRLDPEVVQDDAAQHIEVHRKPLGVVAAIVPWNFPFLIAAYKMAPALITGNTVVIKPAPTTPLTGLLLGEIVKDLVPPGVVNVVTDGGDIGPLLTQHPDIAKVTFTGSTAVGKSVMASAATTLKRLTLELGGNDAAILLDDVDVKEVAPKIFGGAFFNSGQVCIAIKRIYAPVSIYDSLCDELARLAREAKVGDGLDPQTQYGPLQNKKQFESTKRVLELARQHGKVIAGGEAKPGPGYFIPPTIVRDIAEGSSVVDEETFGPVRPVLRYNTLDEAVERANRTPYGLGGSVWSKDPVRAAKVAAQLDCGSAWVNQHLNFGPHIPFGGVKQSGIGVEFAKEGMMEFTDIQTVSVAKQ